jgi:dsRNA-specific ribonuclease
VDECETRKPEYGASQLTTVKSALICNNTLAVIAIRKNLHLVMQQKLTSCQETILQAFVDQKIENRHIFSHQKVSIHPAQNISLNQLFIFQDVRMIPSPKGNLQWEMDYPKVFADLFEAILGAVYKDSGKDLEKTRKVVLDAMEETICKKF